MSFFPRLSYLPLYGGELHRKGGVLLKARLSEWERELHYLRFRMAEWKEFGSVEHPDYYPFRSFLLQKIRHHLHFELKTFSSILVGCEVAGQSDDVPAHQGYEDRIFKFRERISPGEITRHLQLEEWHRYCRAKDEATASGIPDTPSQMDEMFARIRAEIAAMERRSFLFKKIVDELVGMVHEIGEEAERIRIQSGGMGASGGFNDAENGLANSSSSRSARSRLVTHSPSDDPIQMPILADSRARLPPGRTPPIPSAAAAAAAATGLVGSPRLPTSGSVSTAVSASASASTSVSRLRHQASSSSLSSRTTTTPPRPIIPPRPSRNVRRRLFHRVFFAPEPSSPPQPRTPSPSRVPPPPPGTPVVPTEPSYYESPPATSLIAETRTRLPPPPDVSPVPYRPPQRLFSFLP